MAKSSDGTHLVSKLGEASSSGALIYNLFVDKWIKFGLIDDEVALLNPVCCWRLTDP
jgi:hypothetical protein